MRRLFVDGEAPQSDALDEAATWIRAGGIVALPTDTFYGLAADPFNTAAVRRVFDVKGRAEDRALPLIASDARQITEHLGRLTPLAAVLVDRYWPGPLTLLVRTLAGLAREVTGGTGRVGVRVPANDVARAICARAGRPITATSANLSGKPAIDDPDEVEQTMGEGVDILIDTGRTPGGHPSTIVDVTELTPRLIRAGAISWDEIQTWLQEVTREQSEPR